MFSSNIASTLKPDKTSPEMERKDYKSQGTIMPTFKWCLLVMTGKLYSKISSNVVVLDIHNNKISNMKKNLNLCLEESK